MTAIIPKRAAKLSISLLAAGALLAPTLSFANPAQAGQPPMIAMKMDVKPGTEFKKLRKMLQPLNLNAEQQTKVDAAIKAAQPEAAKLHEQIKANHEKLRAQQFADQYDAKTTETLANSQAEYVKQMIMLRSKLDREIYNILTPEQREKLRADMAERDQRKTERRAARAEKQANQH